MASAPQDYSVLTSVPVDNLSTIDTILCLLNQVLDIFDAFIAVGVGGLLGLFNNHSPTPRSIAEEARVSTVSPDPVTKTLSPIRGCQLTIIVRPPPPPFLSDVP